MLQSVILWNTFSVMMIIIILFFRKSHPNTFLVRFWALYPDGSSPTRPSFWGAYNCMVWSFKQIKFSFTWANELQLTQSHHSTAQLFETSHVPVNSIQFSWMSQCIIAFDTWMASLSMELSSTCSAKSFSQITGFHTLKNMLSIQLW